ncbi:hypothetical protein DPMN_039769 [Dreissena polymorpha]|uniref:Uncharacterized protein n=1 Tax=Dreissena polymorpha TaxID=45954 RepID=A0A9D4HUN9_DREPO|nr:hypothetical protein DPMN_039769 [Dreissena polymorpha]
MASKQVVQATDSKCRSLNHEDDTLRATTVWTPTRSPQDPNCSPREQGVRSTNSWTPTNKRKQRMNR